MRIVPAGIVLFCGWAAAQTAAQTSAAPASGNWSVYGGDGGGSKYSVLRQIDGSNVQQLKPAWSFRTGEPLTRVRGGSDPTFEPTPLVVDGVMYFGTPHGSVYGLDAATGKQLWRYDTQIDRNGDYGDFRNRGVSTWVDPSKQAGDPCRRVIYMATVDARLFALDAADGRTCGGFGKAGMLDLTAGLRRGPAYKGEYEETSPPVLIGDTLVVGSGIADNVRVDEPSGEVRAFDARTGALRWTWQPLANLDNVGAGNAWSMISVDEQRGLVFIPTGSASPDYWGGLRPGDNRYANSVVALDAKTGRMVWYFQTVHHDIWDYDVASQPLLYTMKRGSEEIPAVAVGSKTGHLFLLRRDNGQPLFGVEERKVPSSDVEGEHAWPTQPVPVMPKPLVPQSMRVEDAWGPTEADRKSCREQIAGLRNEGIFTPPSLKGTLVIPGNIGGMHWGGMAWDPADGLLVMPTDNFPAAVRLIPQDQFAKVKSNSPGWETTRQRGAPYAMQRQFLRSPSGLPCSAPPWGTLAAIDTATGKVVWQSPLGDFPGVPAKGLGSVNLGGPIVTAGGLVFIGASLEPSLKAFDVRTGKLLWSGTLPASARSTPMTYEVGGKQYVAIAAGGHDADLGKLDNTIMVFALP